MKQVTYRIESELHFQRIVSALEESGISFTTRIYSDSSFPSITQNDAFGDVTVGAESESELRSLIEKLTNAQPARIGETTSNGVGTWKKIWRAGIIAYAVVLTMICLRFWYLHSLIREDKNNMYEWTFDGRELITRSKATDHILHTSEDANFDKNFELSFSYSNQGILLSRWVDYNEDGFYEETIFYDLKGRLTGVQFDRDNDGIVEEATIFLENKDTLKLIDADQNGIFELQKSID